MNIICFIIAIVSSAQMFASSINLEIQYQEAQSLKKIHKSKAIEIEGAGSKMEKTLLVLKLSNLIKSSLTEYHQLNRPYYASRPVPNPGYWEQHKRELSARLQRNLDNLVKTSDFIAHSDISEAIVLIQKLSENMLQPEYFPMHDMRCENFASMKMAAAPSSLNVTSGGVQDYSHFKKQLESGSVPAVEAFIEEGFISSFDLTLPSDACTDIICLNPAYALEDGKLYVQVGMNSNVTPETFTRPPVNLSFVIDISGSMAAMDNTERTRLEWAKEAVMQAVANMNAQDIISIVLFDSVSKVLLQPIPVTDKEKIATLLRGLQPGNSTNLDAGLRDGYLLASKARKEGYQNRVILLSDAGLNTGITDQTTILRLVSDNAADDIGLTAIGIGENFHHDFIHKITMSKSGNAIFVHTGADMMKFFNNFDYLVTPVAYNLKISSEIVGLKAKLVKTYGVPMLKNEPIQELINVRSLFFSEGSGGAIVLEYDL